MAKRGRPKDDGSYDNNDWIHFIFLDVCIHLLMHIYDAYICMCDIQMDTFIDVDLLK